VWHDRAIQTPGLSGLELAVLAAVAGHHRQIRERGYAPSLSLQRLAGANRTEAKYVMFAVRRLVELGLRAVRPGSGSRPNEYLPALPKRLAASVGCGTRSEEHPDGRY